VRSILISFTDGTSRRFEHEGRAGGSYSISIRYEGEFAIVSDEWGREAAFPAARIKDIETQPWSYS